MGDYVRVESIDAMSRFRVALCKFAEAVRHGLDEGEGDIQRTSLWLKQEQQGYWKRQIKKRSEVFNRAKIALNQKKLQRTPLGGKYSCIDEEKALAAATRQLEHAKQKAENVRLWSRKLDEKGFSYKGMVQGMSLAVEVDMPVALAHLDRMIAALDAYTAATPPMSQPSVAPSADVDAMKRPEDLASAARDTAAVASDAGDAYRILRKRTAPPSVRDAAPWVEPTPEWFLPGQTTGVVRDTLAKLDLVRTLLSADDKVIVAGGAWRHERIYIERLAASGGTGCCWYAGFADATQAADHVAVRAVDLVLGRPDLQAALELPAGCLVVFEAASLAAVLDGQDRLLWRSKGPTS